MVGWWFCVGGERKEKKKNKGERKRVEQGSVGFQLPVGRKTCVVLSLASNERSSTGFLFYFFFSFFLSSFFSFLPPPSSEKATVDSSPRNGNSRDTSSVSNCREVTWSRWDIRFFFPFLFDTCSQFSQLLKIWRERFLFLPFSSSVSKNWMNYKKPLSFLRVK